MNLEFAAGRLRHPASCQRRCGPCGRKRQCQAAKRQGQAGTPSPRAATPSISFGKAPDDPLTWGRADNAHDFGIKRQSVFGLKSGSRCQPIHLPVQKAPSPAVGFDARVGKRARPSSSVGRVRFRRKDTAPRADRWQKPGGLVAYENQNSALWVALPAPSTTALAAEGFISSAAVDNHNAVAALGRTQPEESVQFAHFFHSDLGFEGVSCR